LALAATGLLFGLAIEVAKFVGGVLRSEAVVLFGPMAVGAAVGALQGILVPTDLWGFAESVTFRSAGIRVGLGAMSGLLLAGPSITISIAIRRRGRRRQSIAFRESRSQGGSVPWGGRERPVERPTDVTVLGWALWVGGALNVISALFVLAYPWLAQAFSLTPLRMALAALEGLTFLLVGRMLLRGQDAARLLFLWATPVYVVAGAAWGDGWWAAGRAAAYLAAVAFLHGESVRRFLRPAGVEVGGRPTSREL
jgi:hypothetical protein